MKQILAYFFLFISSLQCLPVKAMGKAVAKSQLTEEVKGDCDNDDIVDDDDVLPELFLYADSWFSCKKHHTLKNFRSYHFGMCLIPNWHVPDIHCPPPNY